MKIEEAKLGVRVRSLRDFNSVPKGTEGVIDEVYPDGVMVAWDLPKGTLPADYKVFPGRFRMPPWFHSHVIRDGFDKQMELEFLEVINEAFGI